jgi:hypothetical protein
MILKLSASGWFLFNFIIDDAWSHEREMNKHFGNSEVFLGFLETSVKSSWRPSDV